MKNCMVLVPPNRFSKNVARDLIYGCWCKGKRIAGIRFPPISQLIGATVLRDDGNKVELYDATSSKRSIKDIKKKINQIDFIIILTSTMTINEDAEFTLELKKINRNLKTIFYGSQPTFMPQYTLLKEGVDFIIRREPEYILRDLIKSFSENDDYWKHIKGIGFKENENIILNDYYPFIDNLDDLPIPDRTMLSKDIYYFNPVVKRLPFTTMFTSRGCSGKCTYCASPPFYGMKIRYQSAERVVEEMKLIQKQGYKEVFFRDEFFTINKKRTTDVCELILKNNLDISWICSARIGSVDLETMKLMKRAGCHMIRFGVESGVQDILNNVKKGITIGQTRDTFKWAHQVRIDTHAHCMIGMPRETAQTIKETIRFIKEIDPTIITFGICTPYPGTQLFEEVLKVHPEIGDGSKCDLRKLHTKSFYNEVFTHISTDELNKWIKKIYRSFYFRLNYLWKCLGRIDSLGELKRVILAGLNIFDFAIREE